MTRRGAALGIALVGVLAVALVAALADAREPPARSRPAGRPDHGPAPARPQQRAVRGARDAAVASFGGVPAAAQADLHDRGARRTRDGGTAALHPGTKTAYSNTNYLVLGMLVERLTGKSYGQEIESRIIRPLGLDATSLPGTDPVIPGPHARGYLPVERDGKPELLDITELNPSIMNAGGDIISTAGDLNRFFGALLGGRLLPDNLLREMHTPVLESRYGLGVIRLPLPCGGTAWGKDGDAPGYSSATFVSPRGDLQITVSVTWGAGDPGDAVDALLTAELCR